MIPLLEDVQFDVVSDVKNISLSYSDLHIRNRGESGVTGYS
jgi:hypothetical protein